MSDKLKDRGTSQEAKYAHDEEFKFKATARRNKLLGMWAGRLMGLDDATAAVYAKQVVIADFEEPGDGDVIRKVLKDLADKHPEITEKDVIKKIDEFFKEAVEQLTEEVSK